MVLLILYTFYVNTPIHFHTQVHVRVRVCVLYVIGKKRNETRIENKKERRVIPELKRGSYFVGSVSRDYLV